MPRRKRLAGALAVAATAVAISACGSSDTDKTIEPADADNLQSALTAVQTAIDEGHCGVAKAEADNFVVAVNGLPESVGTDNKEALRAAGENLQQLAGDKSQCKPPPDTGASGDTGVEPTTPTTTPTVTTPTETSTTTSTTSTTSAPPSNQGGGNTGSGGGPPTDTGGGPPSDTGGGGGTGGAGGSGGGTGSGGVGSGGTG